jgi:hypothetical protein
MSIRGRRLISSMTPEAKEKVARCDAEGRDPITGRNLCESVDCGCSVKDDTASSSKLADSKTEAGT